MYDYFIKEKLQKEKGCIGKMLTSSTLIASNKSEIHLKLNDYEYKHYFF